jgi:L-threonylcarbamoyladenylate synthase
VSNRPSIEQQINLAVEILKDGGIVAYPTDTVYGLGANPANEQAIEKIYRVKKRTPELPLPLLLADISDLLKVARVVPDIAWQLAEHFLPGGLTLVLKKSPWVPSAVTAGSDTIAVRVPNHHIPAAIIRGLGAPLVGTSANISGKPSPVTADGVYEQLGEKVDLIIDGGMCPGGIESTVIDISGEIPVIVREGTISRKEIIKACVPFIQKI